MARIGRLDNVEFAKAVGEAYAAGLSRTEMSDLFGAHVDTITTWVRDPRVQAHAGRFAQERANRVARKLDAEFERRLENIDDEDTYPLEVLLKWRKEFVSKIPGAPDGGGANQPETIHEVISTLEDNPELTRELQDALNANKKRA